MNIRETTFNAIVIEAQPFVVEAQQVQNRRVKIVNGGNVIHRSVAEGICGTIRERRFHPSPAIHAVKPAGLWSRPLAPF